MNSNKIRHDPLYRVIDVTDEMNQIEGNFKTLFDRLKQMNNLGIIPEVLEMAKHSKFEHYSGTMYQIESLIDIQTGMPEHYKKPLKTSAIFIHLGHLPFSYSTERSLLLGSYFSPELKQFVEKRLNKVFKSTELDKDEQESILNGLFSLKDYKDLYKYFSAFILIDKWRRVARIGLEDEQKSIVVNNIINSENDGYKLLEYADKVDFVQRDSLYFGTARIDISPKHIYRNLKGSKSYFVDERKLIDNNLDYLEERFYRNSDVRWFTGLYEKILAKLLLSKNFKLDWLLELNDLQLKKLITQNILETSNGNSREKLSSNSINLMKQLFEKEIKYCQLFELPKVHFEKQTAIELEYKLIKKSKKSTGLIEYPFKKNILLTIDYAHSKKIHPSREAFSINLFQNDNKELKIEFGEVIKIIKELREYCSICDISRIEKGLCEQFSWTKTIRMNNKPVRKALAETIYEIETKEPSTVRNLLKDIRNKKKFEKIVYENYHNWVFWIQLIELNTKDTEAMKASYEALSNFLQKFPVFIKNKKVNEFVTKIRDELRNEYYNKPEEIRGHYFEALCLVERLLKPENDLLINGMIVVDPEKPKEETDENEFDIIEFYNENDKIKCNIYACSIADNYRDNFDQLKKLSESIKSKYSDICIKAYYMIPENKARGHWNPIIKEAGLVWNCD